MPRKYGFLTAAAIATALVFATIGTAAAQGRGGGGSAPGGGTPDPSAVIVYGTPGNCPPTMAGCGAPQQPKPTISKKRYDPCGDFAIGSRAYRECRRKL